MYRADADLVGREVSNRASRLQRIRLKGHRTLRVPDCDTPPSRRVTYRQRIMADLVDVVTTWQNVFEQACEALDRQGRPDWIVVRVVDSENARHGRGTPSVRRWDEKGVRYEWH